MYEVCLLGNTDASPFMLCFALNYNWPPVTCGMLVTSVKRLRTAAWAATAACAGAALMGAPKQLNRGRTHA